MDDHRIWAFEEGLWTGNATHYREAIDDECLMVLPAAPFVMTGGQAIEAVSKTPRWSKIDLSERQIMRPQEGLIVVAYKAVAVKDHSAYEGTALRPIGEFRTKNGASSSISRRFRRL